MASDLTSHFRDAAREAAAEGRMVFTPRLVGNDVRRRGDSHDFGEQITAIEAEGWTLAHWSVTVAMGFAEVAHPVFRRRT